jgi:hypothetical protein
MLSEVRFELAKRFQFLYERGNSTLDLKPSPITASLFSLLHITFSSLSKLIVGFEIKHVHINGKQRWALDS